MLVGAFYQRQTNDIFQDYMIDNLAPDLSVNGQPGTLWLTLQERKDKDYALFGEASFDVTPQITLTAGGRLFKYDNSLFGFAGFGKNRTFDEDTQDVPPNGAGGSSGVAALPDGQRRCSCWTTRIRRWRKAGSRARRAPTSATSSTARRCPGGPRATASPTASTPSTSPTTT